MNILGSLFGKNRAKASPPAPALNVEIESIYLRLDTGGSARPGTSQRFSQEEARFLMCEIAVRTVHWQPARLYKLGIRYTTTEGKLLGEERHDLPLKSSYGRQEFSLKTGRDKPG